MRLAAWFERSRARRRSASAACVPYSVRSTTRRSLRAAREADAVVDTAEANHAGVVKAIASALRGSGKPFLHTSGSGIVATDAKGEAVTDVYDEYSAFTPAFPRMVQRAAIDQVVFDCATQGVRSVVIRPTMIYGEGRGARKESAQVRR